MMSAGKPMLGSWLFHLKKGGIMATDPLGPIRARLFARRVPL
jgi:hypothetical protein